MIKCVIWIVLPGVVFCNEIIGSKIHKKTGPPVIIIYSTDDLIQHTFHHQFLNNKKRTNAKTAAPPISALIFR